MKAPSARECAHSHSGVALLMTLAVLVLVTVLVLALFLRMSSERVDSSAAAKQGEAQQLAAGVVDLVKSTITQATAGYESDTTGKFTASRTAWASQPGLIRTWKEDGTPYRSFRLYSGGNSAGSTVVVAGALDITADAPPPSWKSTNASYNALWCDLNAPAASGTNTSVLSYPIVTPPKALDSVNGVEGVQGFAITSPPGFSSGGASATNNPAPMPVKWLYVLRNGTFVSPAGSGSVATVAGASQANPIVGRVAYWTDDETCKVNVNTASEGVYWDIPRARSQQEAEMGRTQPAQNEFNRYPGHPATTSLSAVFTNLSFSLGTGISRLTNIFSLFPRVDYGGSLAGTRQLNPDPAVTDKASGAKPSMKSDRLLANNQEILFAPTNSPRTINTLISSDDIKRTSFFITAASRSPETTLFNTPRVSLWPITTDNFGKTNITNAARIDAFDKTFKFCSTITTNDYFFKRATPRISNFDWNIERNQSLVAYLRNMTTNAIPGYGGSFLGKYGADDLDALLAQVFDFSRSGPELLRLSDMAGQNTQPGFTLNAYGFTYGGPISIPMASLVVPTRTDTTSTSAGRKGMGNFPAISEVGIGFYAEEIEPLDGAGKSTMYISNSVKYFGTNTSRVQYSIRPYLLIETYCATAGWSRVPNIINPVQQNGEDRSVRFCATLDGPAPTVSAIATNRGLGVGTINMPWGKPSELLLGFDSAAATRGPEAFLIESLDARHITNLTTANSASPFLFDGGFQDESKYRYAYRGDIIRLTYDLPSTWATNSEPQRSIVRLESLLTKDDGSSLTEDVPSDWGPRMAFSGADLTLKLGFSGRTNAIPDTDVVQSISVTLPPVASLPVPSITAEGVPYADLSANNTFKTNSTAYLNRHKNSKALPTRLTGDYHNNASKPYENGYYIGKGSNNLSGSPIAQPGDVVRSVEINGRSGLRGDWRLAALAPALDASYFAPVSDDSATGYPSEVPRVHSFGGNMDSLAINPVAATLVAGINFANPKSGYTLSEVDNIRLTSANLTNAIMSSGAPGDWSNQPGNLPDGAAFDMPDVGALGNEALGSVDWYTGRKWSYFNQALFSGIYDNYQFKIMYSPNRQLYSAFQIGTLMTGAASLKPWQTLLFCPNSAATVAGNPHPGTANPPDHLFADLFWVPVVDPYAISEPFSTAGKINLNYRIAPFGYIERSTGIYAVLKSMQIAAIPDSAGTGDNATSYKGAKYSDATPPTRQIRYPIDVAETLKGIETQFSSSDQAFKSETDIAEMFLVPSGATQSNVLSWWSDKRLTGDNTREAPYAQILPRITTKSNTYTVHMRVQALKQTGAGGWDKWDESKDQVMSEYRGSATIERYVDPNDPDIPDFANSRNYSKNLAPYYRWRTVAEKQFIP